MGVVGDVYYFFGMILRGYVGLEYVVDNVCGILFLLVIVFWNVIFILFNIVIFDICWMLVMV